MAGAGAGAQSLVDPTPEQVEWLKSYLTSDVFKVGWMKEELKKWYDDNKNVRLTNVNLPGTEYPTVYFKVLMGYSEDDRPEYKALLEETLRRRPNPTVRNKAGRTVAGFLAELEKEKEEGGRSVSEWVKGTQESEILKQAKKYEERWRTRRSQAGTKGGRRRHRRGRKTQRRRTRR